MKRLHAGNDEVAGALVKVGVSCSLTGSGSCIT